jgi:hypothetical protein
MEWNRIQRTESIMRQNPYALPAYHGLGGAVVPDPQGTGYVYAPRLHQITLSLTANQLVKDYPSEFTDEGEFLWRALFISTNGGQFQIQFTDANGHALSNTMINSSLLTGSITQPFPIFPEVVFPKSSKISVTVQELAGSPATLNIVLIGVLRALPKI